MTGKLRGIIRGQLIELNEPAGFPDGTEVEVTIIEESYINAWKRQQNLMKSGFPMGQRRSIKREDLYERG